MNRATTKSLFLVVAAILGSAVLLLAMSMLPSYIESQPWRRGWSPIIDSSKAVKPSPSIADLLERSSRAVATERQALADQIDILDELAQKVDPKDRSTITEMRRAREALNVQQKALTAKQSALEALTEEIRRRPL